VTGWLGRLAVHFVDLADAKASLPEKNGMSLVSMRSAM
jgi:hypothetical protein